MTKSKPLNPNAQEYQPKMFKTDAVQLMCDGLIDYQKTESLATEVFQVKKDHYTMVPKPIHITNSNYPVYQIQTYSENDAKRYGEVVIPKSVYTHMLCTKNKNETKITEAYANQVAEDKTSYLY